MDNRVLFIVPLKRMALAKTFGWSILRRPYFLLLSQKKVWGKKTLPRRGLRGTPLKQVSMGKGATDALLSFGACAKAKSARQRVTQPPSLWIPSSVTRTNPSFFVLPVKFATKRNLKGPYSYFHALRAGAVENVLLLVAWPFLLFYYMPQFCVILRSKATKDLVSKVRWHRMTRSFDSVTP